MFTAPFKDLEEMEEIEPRGFIAPDKDIYNDIEIPKAPLTEPTLRQPQKQPSFGGYTIPNIPDIKTKPLATGSVESNILQESDEYIFNKLKQAYDYPTQKSIEGWKLILDTIPDPQTKSAALNIVLGSPKTAAAIFTEFSAQMGADPLVLASYGIPKILKARALYNELKALTPQEKLIQKYGLAEAARRSPDVFKQELAKRIVPEAQFGKAVTGITKPITETKGFLAPVKDIVPPEVPSVPRLGAGLITPIETTAAGEQALIPGVTRSVPTTPLSKPGFQAPQEDLLEGFKPPAPEQPTLFDKPVLGGGLIKPEVPAVPKEGVGIKEPVYSKEDYERARQLRDEAIEEYRMVRESNIINDLPRKISVPKMRRSGFGGELDALYRNNKNVYMQIFGDDIKLGTADEVLQELADVNPMYEGIGTNEFLEMVNAYARNYQKAPSKNIKDYLGVEPLDKYEKKGYTIYEKGGQYDVPFDRRLSAIPDKQTSLPIQQEFNFTPEEATKRGWKDIRGEIARTPEDAASLTKDYRNPKRELGHFIYTNENGRVLAHTVLTSNLLDSATFTEKEIKYSVNDRANRLNATKVYFVHNHPVGDPRPSKEDIAISRLLKYGRLGLGNKFGGSIVTNHDKMAVISPGKDSAKISETSIDLGKSYASKETVLGMPNEKEFVKNHFDFEDRKLSIFSLDNNMRPVGQKIVHFSRDSYPNLLNMIKQLASESNGSNSLLAMSENTYNDFKKYLEANPKPMPFVEIVYGQKDGVVKAALETDFDLMAKVTVGNGLPINRKINSSDLLWDKKPSMIRIQQEPSETYGQKDLIEVPPTQPPSKVGRGGLKVPDMDLENWKDKMQLAYTRETTERNIEDIAGKDTESVKKFLVYPIRENETNSIKWANEIRKSFSDKLDKLGIKMGSEEDFAIMDYGEKLISLEELKEKTPNWEKVVEAEKTFRNFYDTTLDKWNAQRQKFGYAPVPKRQDYFRHYTDITSAIKNFGVFLRKEDLPTEIAGITDIFKPGKPFSTAELRRQGKLSDRSAIRGLDNYIDSVRRAIFHIDSMQRSRQLTAYIRKMAKFNPKINIPGFVRNLEAYSRFISGKKSKLDYAIEEYFGRTPLAFFDALKRWTGKNMILGNISSALTNFIVSTTQLPATTPKKYFLAGLFKGMETPLVSDKNSIDGIESSFLVRRFPETNIQKTGGEKLESGLAFLFNAIDRFSARAVVAAKYYEGIFGLKLSPEDAMKRADAFSGKMMTDRSIGQLPVMMNAKTIGWLTQFQTEINNIVSFMYKDIPREKKGFGIVSAIIQLLIYNYVYNEASERITGRRVVLDPIDAVLTMLGIKAEDKDKKLSDRFLETIREVAGNLPFVGGITGGRFPVGAGLPNIGGLIRGTTTASKELVKPLALWNPFGAGMQIKKTVEGLSSYGKGYTESTKGRVRHPIEKNIPNLLRSAAFGKYSTPESRKYFDTQSKVLGEKQTEAFKRKSAEEQKSYYDRLQERRKKQRSIREKRLERRKSRRK